MPSHLVGAIAADAEVEAEIGAAADLGAIVMDRAQPVERPLHERVRRHQHAERADIERLQRVQDQSHVVIERHPVDIGRLPGVAERDADHFQIGKQIGVADRDALGFGGRARRVLQEGDVLRLRGRQIGCAGLGDAQIDREPRNPFARNRACRSSRIAKARTGERERRLAIGHDRGAGVARAVPARHHHRHGDHPCDQAAEEGDDEFEAGRKHQHGAIAGLGDPREPRRERLRGVMQLAEGEGGFFHAAITEGRCRRDRPAGLPRAVPAAPPARKTSPFDRAR